MSTQKIIKWRKSFEPSMIVCAVTFFVWNGTYTFKPVLNSVSRPTAAIDLSRKHLVERDRQFADAFAGCVVNCIRDSGADAGDADLTNAVRAHWRVRIGDIGPDHIDLGHVHVHGHVVLGEARVHKTRITLVEMRLLHTPE